MIHRLGTSASWTVSSHTARPSSVRANGEAIPIGMKLSGASWTPIENGNWPWRTGPAVLKGGRCTVSRRSDSREARLHPAPRHAKQGHWSADIIAARHGRFFVLNGVRTPVGVDLSCLNAE